MKTILWTLLIVTLITTTCFGQAWSGILAPARATDWTYAGIPGGIPSGTWTNCVTTACNTFFSTPTGANCSTAMASAPNNTVVRGPAGTITGICFSNRSNVVLRGAGPGSTTWNGTIFIGTNGNGTNGLGSYPPNLSSTNWTAGYTKGTTVLTVASTTGIVAGQNVILDQHNDFWVYTAGQEGACIVGNSCGRNDSPLQFNGSATRAQPQMVHVVSVDSSTQLTLSAPGLAFDHNSSLAPQVFFWNSGTGNIKYNGVENMTVDCGLTDDCVSAPFCDYCWAKNLVVKNIARAGIFFWWGTNDEVRDSYISASNTAGAPTEYGIEVLSSTYTKVENNIFFGVTSPVLPETAFGCVVGYNYALNTATGAQFGSFETHLSEAYGCLYEGNVTPETMWDNSWGGAVWNTGFRNALSGHGSNKNNYRAATKVNAQNHYMSIVGSVLGDPTYHTLYECGSAGGSCVGSTDNYEYDLGFFNAAVNGIQSASISSFTGTSGTLTFTDSGTGGFGSSGLVADQNVSLSGFTGGNTGLNGQNVRVLAAGLNSTHFEAVVTGSGYSSGTGTVKDYDTVTESSLFRWANWDAVTWNSTGGVHGTRYCTGSGTGSSGADAANSACTASETANADPDFPGLASPSTTLPPSFYNGAMTAQAACGTGLSFWKDPSSGTCPIYPPIGPDVACSTNCIANTASHAAQIPAQRCYNNTAKTSGFLTAFDATACYANDPVIITGIPGSPTGLAAIVN